MRDAHRKARLAHLIATDYGSRSAFLSAHDWVSRSRLSQAIGYLYVTTRGNVYTGFKNHMKALVLTFDESDKVLDIEFTTSGNK